MSRRITALICAAALSMTGSAIAQVTSGTKPPPPPQTTEAAQLEWEKVSVASARLALDDKTSEAIAMVRAFLARHPNVGDAHFVLARLYEDLAGYGEIRTPEQQRHLENAVIHYGRAAELMADADARFVMIWKLVQLHGTDQLNRPAEEERFARRLVEEHPARAESHMAYAQMRRSRGDIAAAADALRKGRALADMPTIGSLMLLQYLVEQVQASRDLSREITRKLLEEAIAVTDAIIAAPGVERRDYRLATMGKAMALELLAERVEQDRQRRIALLAESKRFGAAIEEHVNGAPPPARPLSTEEAAELEWEALDRWNAALVDEGRHADAVASYRRYLAERPTFAPAHARLAAALMKAASDAKDPQTRASNLTAALIELQRVFDLLRLDAARPGETSQRLLYEADSVVTQAEQLEADSPDVLETRAKWLQLNAAVFEKDPARARSLSDEATRLISRAVELRRKR